MTESFKILRVVHSMSPKTGGPAQWVKSSSKAMSNQGLDIDVLTLSTGNDPSLKDSSFRIYNLNTGSGNYGFSIKVISWLKSNIKHYNYIIIEGLWQFPGLATSFFAKRHKIPYAIYPHGMLDPWFNKNSFLKKIKKNIYWKFFESSVINGADSVFYTAPEEMMLAKETFPGYKGKSKVMPIGVDDPLKEESPTNTEDIVCFPWSKMLLFLGRIHPKKGVDLLIEAWAEICKEKKDIQLLIVGPGDDAYKKKLEALQEGLKATNITWVSMVKGAAKWSLISQASAFILPSHQENFGIALAEAMSMSKPVLTTHAVNISGTIKAFDGGVISTDTLCGVQDLLKFWTNASHKELGEMGARARTCFEKEFEMNLATEKLVELIKYRCQT